MYEVRGELSAASKERWVEKARKLLGKKLAAAKKPVREKALVDPNLANIHDLRARDHTWQETTGFGLSHFVPQRVCKPLAVGEDRFWIPVGSLPPRLREHSHGRARRACLRLAGGGTTLEVHWHSQRALLHCWLDMGAVGWPPKHAAFLKWGMRGSFSFDPAHRRWDNI